ncbi:MAG: hypothetical protein Q8Q05_00195 [bacterium]|nr:hypothetical protein [bacterium]
MRIGVAGSMQFTEKMVEACDRLKKLGHSVFISSFGPSYIGKSAPEYDKHGIKNYIGGNTFLEMGFAHILNQKIFLLNPVPEMPYYQTEIVAMRPVVINGDFAKIK